MNKNFLTKFVIQIVQKAQCWLRCTSDDKTIAAFSILVEIDGDGTKMWLQIVRNCWLSVNVKHPKKRVHLLRSVDQEIVNYLQLFCAWL